MRSPSRLVSLGTTILACGAALVTRGFAQAQQPAFGPTQSTVEPAAVTWPAVLPQRIYVLPFSMDPAVQEELARQGPLPAGPVRSLLAGRPRVTDAITGLDRTEPAGTAIARIVADELAQAGYPAVFWTRPEAPPADGWRLGGRVVAIDDGNAVARNVVGFGVGNKTIAIDVGMSDPATAGGRPFFILDTSDAGRRTPGTLPIAAVAGFNPYVVAGKLVASGSGIADVTQQRRLADEIAVSVAQAIVTHARPAAPAATPSAPARVQP